MSDTAFTPDPNWSLRLRILRHMRALITRMEASGADDELVTIPARELQKLRDERDKFMWQVRDTCARAEKAEAALALARGESS